MQVCGSQVNMSLVNFNRWNVWLKKTTVQYYCIKWLLHLNAKHSNRQEDKKTFSADGKTKKIVKLIALRKDTLFLKLALFHKKILLKTFYSEIKSWKCNSLFSFKASLKYPTNIYLFIVNNKKARKRWRISSKLTTKTPHNAVSRSRKGRQEYCN